MDEYLRREVHDEFARRMEEEHERQNHRIREMEETQKQNKELLLSVKELALHMKNMQEEMKKQNDRLEALEGRDGELWRKVAAHVITSVISIVMGFIFAQIGM